MDDATLYRITTWRKRLERRGWTSLRRARPPRGRLIEYHVIWEGQLVSGRVRLADLDDQAYWQPGSPIALLERGLDVVEGVWRVARDPGAVSGQVRRPVPWDGPPTAARSPR
ncbi:hypothetical protein SAMN04487957_110154 [Halomonas shengliensis]|uniref:Uncharacterized protein n=1 Tax=Halomonas shengliensis TaxID=419597 RepID=A0A1H0LYD1_9GAMM|nr:hypothetical protein [Halomonas shengliensis]SDO73157.1 hypothetical protein SAMN04487957_110154 [Halomonas shengliensis]